MRFDVLSPRALPYAVTLGFLGAGAFVGLVVATGKLVLIALVIGGLAGLLLLNALPVAVWMLLIGVFLINGPVAYFFPGLAKIAWLFSLLGVFMSGAALLYAAAGRERPARPMPAFVYLALAFAAFAAFAVAFSNGSMSEVAAGAKRQFHFWGVIFLFALVPFSSAHIRRWLIFLLGVAIVQLPFALVQRVLLVPQVMGLDRPGFVPFDIVVGSFEGSMYGGGASAIMAMFLVIACVGLLCAYREQLIGTGRFLALLAVTLIPLGLGETKIVLPLIPVILFFAFHDTVVKRPLAFIGAALLTVLVGAVFTYLYFIVQVSGAATWRDGLAATFDYNFGERGYYGTGVNRLTAIPYWFESQSWADPLRTLFGYGLGSSYGVDGRAPLTGHMFIAHAGMHIDLVTTSLMLWDFGLAGTLLFFGTLLMAVITAARCLAEAVTAWDRTLCRLLLASLGASLLMMFYSASVVVLVSHSFIVALTLGLIAWRTRHGPLLAFQTESSPQPRARPVSAGTSRRRGRDIFPQPPGQWPVHAGSKFAGASKPGFSMQPTGRFAQGGNSSIAGRVEPAMRARADPDSRGRIEPTIDTGRLSPRSP